MKNFKKLSIVLGIFIFTLITIGAIDYSDCSIYGTCQGDLWDRSGNTIFPSNPNDNLLINGNIQANQIFTYNLTSINITHQNLTVIDNLDVLGNVTADNFIGNHIGNSSIWSRAGTNTFLTNLGDSVGVNTTTPRGNFEVVGKGYFTNFLSVGEESCNPNLHGDGNLCVDGNIFSNKTISSFASIYGASIVGGSSNTQQVISNLNFTGILNLDGKTFCDVNGAFTQETKNRNAFIFSSNPTTIINAVMYFNDFINSTCMSVNTGNFGELTGSFTNIAYAISKKSTIMALDNDLIFFNIGEYDDSTFEITIPKAKGDNKFSIKSTLIDNSEIMNLFIDMNESSGVNFDSCMFSNSINNDSTLINSRIEADLNNFRDGEYVGLNINLIGTHSSMDTSAIIADSKFNNILLTTDEKEISRVYYDDTISTTDITNQVNNSLIQTDIFENNASVIYIGNIINFTKLDFSIQDKASNNIQPQFYYCTSGNVWKSLNSFEDGTDGFTQSGTINFINPTDRGECNEELDSTPFTDSTPYTYIAIQRTEQAVTSTPSLTTAKISLDSSNLFIGDDSGLISGAPNTIFWLNEELLQEGEPYKSNLFRDSEGNIRVGNWWISRQNESASGNANSLMTFPDNDLIGDDRTNLTKISNVVERWDNYGITSAFDYDSSQNRTGIASLYSMETQSLRLHNDLGQGSYFGEGAFVQSIENTTEATFIGGSIRNLIPVTYEEGFNQSEIVSLATENFIGGLGIFNNDENNIQNWISIDDGTYCEDSPCAGAQGNGADVIMHHTTLSTLGFNETNLQFYYGLFNIIGADEFSVTANNNEGSGDVLLFSDSGTDLPTLVNLTLSSDFTNKTQINITVTCDATQLTRFCFFDEYKVFGKAIENTITNQTGNDVEICGSTTRGLDGRCDVSLYYSAERGVWDAKPSTNFTGGGGGSIGGSGTTDNWAKWFSPLILGDAPISDDGSEINTTLPLNVDGNFRVNDTLFVDSSSERVGIGTTTPDITFHIESFRDALAKFESTDDYVSLNLLDNSDEAFFGIRGSTNNFFINDDNSDGGFVFKLDGTDYVGIGTDSPNRKLTVNATGTNYIQITNEATGSSSTAEGFNFGVNNAGKSVIWNYENTDMIIGTNNAQRMTILSGGNIGIGTTNPQNKLDVSGGQVIGSSYAGTNTAPTDGLLVEGRLGVNTTNPLSLLHLDGGVGSLSTGLSFGDGDTGFYEAVDDTLNLAIVGIDRWKFTASAMGGTTTGFPTFRGEVASSTNPNILPRNNDIDTGLGSPDLDQLSLIAGGVEGIRVNSGNSTIYGDLNSTNNIYVGNNVTLDSGATFWSNSTCAFISSPGGTTTLEVCD